MGQGRPHLQGRPDQVVQSCLAHVACWFQFLPKCVPTHENHNTTRGTLLVLKMCMNLAVYSSRTWGFDGRIFVVRNVNTPHPGPLRHRCSPGPMHPGSYNGKMGEEPEKGRRAAGAIVSTTTCRAPPDTVAGRPRRLLSCRLRTPTCVVARSTSVDEQVRPINGML
jgi:hypothetical protein